MPLPLLLSLFLFFSSSSASRFWFAAPFSPPTRATLLQQQQQQQPTLYDTVDFRGQYGSLGLFVANDVSELPKSIREGISHREKLISTEKTIMALMCEKRQAENIKLWEREVGVAITSTGLDVLAAAEGVVLVVLSSDQLEDFTWPRYTSEVLAPSVPLRAPSLAPPIHHPIARFFNISTQKFDFTGFEPDPFIQEVVSRISGPHIMTWISHLSAIFTRLSPSTGAKEAEDFLFGAYPSETFTVSRHAFRPDFSYNVIAERVGVRYPDKYVIIGAHYDSRSTSSTDVTLRAPGADDNGSGTASILELVRQLLEAGIQFEYSVRYIHWSGEEQGLLGSRALAQQYAQDGVDVLAYLNFDMGGYQLPDTPIVVGMKDRSVTDWLMELTDAITTMYVPETRPGRSPSCCSDYLAFFENGYATVGYFENEGSAADYPHYHRSTDTPDQIVVPNLEAIARAFVAGFLTLAVPVIVA